MCQGVEEVNSDEDWTDDDNINGEELDMSVVFAGEGSSSSGKKKLKQDKMMETIQKVMESSLAGQAKMSEETTRILSTMAAVMEKQQEAKAREEERLKEKEKEKEETRKRKEAEGPEIKEDVVEVVEKTLTIKDDSNGTIDIVARSTLGRNPNAAPAEWIGGEKQWPRVARPAVGQLLEMAHICPAHVAPEAVLSFHDTFKYLELKHFINRNSGQLGKVKVLSETLGQ